jgi:tRNA A-37 threonylcarbamoyl transferase component Bud32
MPITCPNPICHQLNRDTARFCQTCGTPLVQAGSPPGMPLTGRLPPNTLLAGRYLILCKIDQGGMAAVYQASDVRLPGKLWAVKEMSDAAITDPTEKQRAINGFLREAQLLASLDHSNIPKVIDSFSHTSKYYLVMEYVDGNTLETLLVTQGCPFTEAEVRAWLDQLCNALSYLHACHPSIIFRDLKPANIMLDRNGQIKLIDFGIARLFQPGKARDTTLLGTAGYAPPEQYGQGQSDQRSDIYALGATLHRLLTGHDPATTPLNLPPVRQLYPTISSVMDQVITRALEQDPRKRWQSVGEIQAVLRPGWAPPSRGTVRAGPGQQAQPRLSRPTTRLLLAVAQLSTRQLALAVGSLVVLVAVGIWVLAPIVEQSFPVIWNNVPAFAIVGPAAYAAARRRGAAILAHIPITLAGWLTWWARIGYAPPSYLPLVMGTTISGLALETGLNYLPEIRGKARDEAWKREIGWFALLAAVAAILFYAPSENAMFSVRPGMWVGAAVLGVSGWFLGDLVQQWLFLRQTGMRRVTPP